MNYYEHHIGDYDADTAHLTWAQDMAYSRLLRLYYRREKPIPSDIGEACRLVRARSREEKKAVTDMLAEFFSFGDDGWHQARCDSEISDYQIRVEHNRRVGKLGGRPKKQEPGGEPEHNPLGSFRVSEQNPSGSFREPEHNPPQTPDPRPQTNTKKEEGSARKRAARTRVPDDFAPNDVGVKAATDAGLNVQAELQRFRNHHEATGSLMASWQAAWRTWVSKAVEFGRGKPAKALNGNTEWLAATGFANVAEAQNHRCHIGNASQFRNGHRIGVEA